MLTGYTYALVQSQSTHSTNASQRVFLKTDRRLDCYEGPMRYLRLLTHPTVAVALGAFLALVETCRHFDALLALPASWTALPIPDWIAGPMLIAAGTRRGRTVDTRRVLLIAAWAFALSLFIAAFFSHLEEWSSPTHDEWPSQHLVTIVVGALALLSLGALVAIL